MYRRDHAAEGTPRPSPPGAAVQIFQALEAAGAGSCMDDPHLISLEHDA